jgi:hypothetical protein
LDQNRRHSRSAGGIEFDCDSRHHAGTAGQVGGGQGLADLGGLKRSRTLQGVFDDIHRQVGVNCLAGQILTVFRFIFVIGLFGARLVDIGFPLDDIEEVLGVLPTAFMKEGSAWSPPLATMA